MPGAGDEHGAGTLSSVQLQSHFETKRRMWFCFLQRREELRQRLHLDKYLAPEMNAEPAARDAGGPRAAPAAVDMFDCDGVTTTVTTIAMNSDDEQCVLLLTTMSVGWNAVDTCCKGLSVTTSAMHSDDEQQVLVSCFHFHVDFPLHRLRYLLTLLIQATMISAPSDWEGCH